MLLESVFQAVSKGAGVPELEEYLRHQGGVDDRDPISGWTLLHHACEHKNHAVICLLIKCGANVNAITAGDSKATPLHVAVDIDIDSAVQRTGNLTQVTFATSRLLLKAGADPDLPDSRGQTPRKMASGYDSSLAERFNRLVEDDTVK